MATLSDGFKDIFLAGIGAMAITGEKTKDLVDQLISKGELTVDQGKQINTELKHKAEDVAASVRYDVLEARMAAMTPEERAAFVAKAAEFAEKYFRQGMRVLVSGRIQTGSYVNKEGQKVYTTEVILDDQEFADSKGAASEMGGYAQAAPSQRPAPTSAIGDGFMNIPDGVEDEGLPFN